jgi:hypothetical protein
MPNGITIEATVLERELEGTDEEFLARNPLLCEAVENLVSDVRGQEAAG